MKVYLVAGEPSGDLLASGLMKALMAARPNVEFRGVGGESMTALGLHSLFDIAEISVMGFFEVLPRLPLILKRLKETTDDIERWQPDVLVTVDSWGFASSLLSRLKKRGSKVPVVHYVAPQVWAWKKGRAKNVARLVDCLMMLLPHEGQYFEKYGLRCEFVGHPLIERVSSVDRDHTAFRKRLNIPEEARVICVLPGSRRMEIIKLAPVFQKALHRIRAKIGDFYVVIPTVAAMEGRIRQEFADVPFPIRVVQGEGDRYSAFSISDVALAASGTVSLELVALGVPHIIAHTFNPLTNALVKMLIKVRFANLINLQADREVIPEFVLNNCRPEPVADCVIRILENPQLATVQVSEAQEILQRLRLPDILPSEQAAQVVGRSISE